MMEKLEGPIHFGEWVKLRRKALDLTQEELGRQAGCSVFALRKIESGERRPSKQLAGLLATPLQIPSQDREKFIKMARGDLSAGRLKLVAPGPGPLPDLDLIQGHQSPGRRDNVPAPSTPLVGRAEELSALEAHLKDPQCRLLTITGLGGVGKTRLAIEAASLIINEQYPDGVWFVSLVSLNSEDFIIPAIGDALGLTFYGSPPLREQLHAYLRGKQALIVLDNFEHLIGGVDILLGILNHAPKIKLLVTSRERLNLMGEWVFEIEGLPVPPLEHAEAAEGYSSYKLFVQSAQRVQANFNPDRKTRQWIIQICQLIQGIPLGIVLAAAWTPVLSPQEIFQEVQHNLEFLTIQMRDLPERHRSLYAILESSWRQLSGDEKQVLYRLSYFRGGFRRQAAEQVTGASLGTLSSLVGKCLLHHNPDGRYDLHELVRQFAASQLEMFSGEKDQIRLRFSQYYANLLYGWESQLQSRDAILATAEMGKEINNLRQAWVWMATLGQTQNLAQSLFSIWWYHELQGWFKEGIRILEQAVQALRGMDAPPAETTGAIEPGYLLAKIQTRKAFLQMRCGEFDQAGHLLGENLPVLMEGPDHVMYAYGLRYLGTLEYVKGNYPSAHSLMEKSVALLEADCNRWAWVGSMIMYGDILRMQGDYKSSYAVLSQCVSVARDIGEPRMASSSLRYLGAVSMQLGRQDEASRLLEESLVNSQATNDRWNQSRCLISLGEVALQQMAPERAEIYFRESISLSRQLGDLSSLPESLTNLGMSLHIQGNLSEANLSFLEALQRAIELDLPPVALEAIVGIATVRYQEGKAQTALEMARFALDHPAIYYEAAERAGRICFESKLHLNLQEIQAAENRARSLTFTTIFTELREQIANPFNEA
jgi:predicted ATPase/transcriptional regulator with XRE-family HTH domain